MGCPRMSVCLQGCLPFVSLPLTHVLLRRTVVRPGGHGFPGRGSPARMQCTSPENSF